MRQEPGFDDSPPGAGETPETQPDANPDQRADERANRKRLLRRIAWISAGVVGSLAVGFSIWIAVLVPQVPSVADLRDVKAAKPSVLMSADGQELMSFRAAQQQRVPLAKISPHVVAALIATEDHRFYEHRGVDWQRTASSVLHTLVGDKQGGSTITQQLARNLLPEDIGRDRTPNRKIKEIIAARRIERVYNKREILEAYLNTAPFLYNAVGIEMAAHTYFDKTAAELSVNEAATLVGMLKGTHYFNPVIHPKRATARRNTVLSQMVRRGVLPEADYVKLRDEPLQVDFTRLPEVLGSAPHFALHARKFLAEWADQHELDLYADGLVITTTIDSRLQAAATQAVERQAEGLQAVADVEWSTPNLRVLSGSTEAYAKARVKAQPFAHFWTKRADLLGLFIRESVEYKRALQGGATPDGAFKKVLADAAFMDKLKAEKTRLEAGFVAIDPASGEVRAWVGSRDYDQGQFDHVAQAARQPGSTFKPFVYGAALESGIHPDQAYVDGPVEIPLSDGTVWRPTDMSGTTGLPMSLREGLIFSKNTITAQVMRDVGVQRVATFAQAMGIESKLDMVPSLALGTSPVTLLEMVNAYATIAREGQYHKPIFIKRIADRHGKVLAEFGSETRRGMSPEVAVDLIDMMRGVVNRGTGTAVKTRFGIVADIAGKTGTTQNNTDGWFILMHPNLVAGAWVGFNDARVTMRSSHWGQGGHNAILLVGDFFRESIKDKRIDTAARFPPPRRPPPPALEVVAPAASAPAAEDWARDGEALPPGDAREVEPPPSVTIPPLPPTLPRDGAELLRETPGAGLTRRDVVPAVEIHRPPPAPVSVPEAILQGAPVPLSR